MTGGVGALVGAIICGPRKGRFEKPEEFEAHSMPLVVLGTFLLWFGWYGFNCGSTLSMATAGKGHMAALVAMNTTISAATGGVTVLLAKFIILQKYDIGAMCNGILAGLVAITAPCGAVESGSAVAIGCIGAMVYLGASTLLKKLKIDDPVDAFAVHGATGAWGVLAAVLFDFGTGFTNFNGWSGFSCMTKEDGTCNDTAWSGVFAANLMEILTVTAWVATLTALVMVPLKLGGLLRASDDIQDAGMDAVKHSPPKAYVMESKAEGTSV
jgi:Amt family ammonium transporter